MKKYFLLTAIMLIFSAFVCQPAMCLDKPYGIGDPNQDSGDDHPWGGEDNSTDPPKWKPDSNDKNGAGTSYFDYLLKPFYMFIIDQHLCDYKSESQLKLQAIAKDVKDIQREAITSDQKTSYRGF